MLLKRTIMISKQKTKFNDDKNLKCLHVSETIYYYVLSCCKDPNTNIKFGSVWLITVYHVIAISRDECEGVALLFT